MSYIQCPGTGALQAAVKQTSTGTVQFGEFACSGRAQTVVEQIPPGAAQVAVEQIRPGLAPSAIEQTRPGAAQAAMDRHVQEQLEQTRPGGSTKYAPCTAQATF
jgi:hypothetical protein